MRRFGRDSRSRIALIADGSWRELAKTAVIGCTHARAKLFHHPITNAIAPLRRGPHRISREHDPQGTRPPRLKDHENKGSPAPLEGGSCRRTAKRQQKMELAVTACCETSLGGHIRPLGRLIGDVHGKCRGTAVERLYFLDSQSLDYPLRGQRPPNRLGKLIADAIRRAHRSEQSKPYGSVKTRQTRLGYRREVGKTAAPRSAAPCERAQVSGIDLR